MRVSKNKKSEFQKIKNEIFKSKKSYNDFA